MFVALTNFSSGFAAEKINHDDLAVRKALLDYGYALIDKGKYSEAVKYFRFGIKNWTRSE